MGLLINFVTTFAKSSFTCTPNSCYIRNIDNIPSHINTCTSQLRTFSNWRIPVREYLPVRIQFNIAMLRPGFPLHTDFVCLCCFPHHVFKNPFVLLVILKCNIHFNLTFLCKLLKLCEACRWMVVCEQDNSRISSQSLGI